MPDLRVVTDEPELHDLLEQANEKGDLDGICLPSRDFNGVGFLSSLAEEGGDSTYVEYITADEEGKPWNRYCEECGGRDPDAPVIRWTPTFPIWVMGLWPLL